MVIVAINQLTEGLELNETLITRRHQQHRYTIDELLDARFPKSISGDIDMDPCKSSKYGARWRVGALQRVHH